MTDLEKSGLRQALQELKEAGPLISCNMTIDNKMVDGLRDAHSKVNDAQSWIEAVLKSNQ